MNELESPKLAALLFLERVQRADLARTQRWIEQERARLAEEERRRTPPPPPPWLIEHSIGGPAEQRALAVHTGDCWIGSRATRTHALTREQALAALAEGVPACTVCRPDTDLGVLDA